MDMWNKRQHRESGLIDRVRQSKHDCRRAEEETLAFIQAWVEHRASPMCGNSVWHDRRFLARYMPTLEAYFHYRNIDVSTLKELAVRWGAELPQFTKACHHLAQGRYSRIHRRAETLWPVVHQKISVLVTAANQQNIDYYQ